MNEARLDSGGFHNDVICDLTVAVTTLQFNPESVHRRQQVGDSNFSKQLATSSAGTRWVGLHLCAVVNEQRFSPSVRTAAQWQHCSSGLWGCLKIIGASRPQRWCRAALSTTLQIGAWSENETGFHRQCQCVDLYSASPETPPPLMRWVC